jgi:hypothetical protein
VQLGVVFLIAVANFHLTAGLLKRRVAVGHAAVLASAGDIFMITMLIASQGGLRSDLYIFYFPALLAIALAFPAERSAVFTVTTATVYGIVALTGFRTDSDLQTIAVRVAMLLAVGLCGTLSWKLEQARRAKRMPMTAPDAEAREAAEDLFFGQEVMLWARWFVLGTAMGLALWSANTTEALVRGIAPVVVLLAVNFYLHARHAMDKPANRALLSVASALDIAAVGAILLSWNLPTAQQSPLFVLAYPLLASFALVFRPRAAAVYATIAVGAYVAVCVITNPELVSDANLAKTLVLRAVTLGATAGLGAYYWRMLRLARRTAGTQVPRATASDSRSFAEPAAVGA